MVEERDYVLDYEATGMKDGEEREGKKEGEIPDQGKEEAKIRTSATTSGGHGAEAETPAQEGQGQKRSTLPAQEAEKSDVSSDAG